MIHADFVRVVQEFERTRRKIELRFDQRLLAQRDVSYVYSSMFVTLTASFETAIEDLFIGLLSGALRGNRVIPRIRCGSPAIARDIVYRGKAYLDWLPYERTEQAAAQFFARGRPFSNLDASEKAVISEAVAIRNAIAHKSEFARKAFEKKVLANLTLLPRDRNPPTFLRSVLRVSPIQRRYENYANELARILGKLST